MGDSGVWRYDLQLQMLATANASKERLKLRERTSLIATGYSLLLTC